MEKKRVLFVIESLNIGGAEKSLVTLLNLLDYSKYDVDLLLFSADGAFRDLLPAEVNVLPVPDYFAYCSVEWAHLTQKLQEPKKLFAQLKYSLGIRLKKMNHTEKAEYLWKTCSRCMRGLDVTYDMAVAYAQGVPTFYVMDKVKAKKKAAWINVTYQPKGKSLTFIKPYYDRYDVVNAVSDSVKAQMQATFDIPESKTMVMRDILDVDFAQKMAKMDGEVSTDMGFPGVKILTVGRLANMKGHDLAIEAAKLLADRGLDFRWYAVGEGPLYSDLEQQIKANHLEERFILLGKRTNPYPYFKACDIYAQPSRFEGFGITLAEAKMFRKPIVTTNFDAVGSQFVNEKNGLIVEISAQAIADGIIRMVTDDNLRETCVANIVKEKIGNTEEIEKFYKIVGA